MTRKSYHGFGGRLHHEVPAWVPSDATYHVRIRCSAGNSVPLTRPEIAPELLESFRLGQASRKWSVSVVLLMPDHLHALLSFPPEHDFRRVIGSWKRFQARTYGVDWQEGFFDHRLRDRDKEFTAKRAYILNNPIAKGLCASIEDWPWWYETSVQLG